MSLTAKSPVSQPGFDFNIGQVAALLDLTIRRRAPGGIDADCPFCGHAYKLNLNLSKNVYRCNRCGKGGGMLDLYRDCRGLTDRKEAFREIREGLLGMPVPAMQAWDRAARQSRENQAQESLRAPVEVCDQTYRMMLELLPLREEHRQNLMNRGLSEEQIALNGYRSTFLGNTQQLTSSLLKKGCILKGVPGFYQGENGEWRANFSRALAGILIPVRDTEGHILGMQIRLDKPIGKNKYPWLSSVGRKSGVTSGSPPHFVGDRAAKTVYITEGPLKADIARFLLGKTFGAIAGVSQFGSLKQLLSDLKSGGVETICEAYDMDCRDNPAVEAARLRLIEMAREFGFKVYAVTWSPAYKGIDDWALAKKQQKI